jgi:competence protein ComEC
MGYSSWFGSSSVGRLSLAVVCVAAFAGGIAWDRYQANPETRLSFLAVGQGDCTVFQHAGHVVVIDTAAETEDYSATRRIVLPELRALGVRKIDLLILTHPDSDHMGGLDELQDRFRIGAVMIAEHFKEHPQIAEELEESGIKPDAVTWIDSAVQAEMGDFNLMVKPPPFMDGEDNEGSLFVKLEGPGSAVFSGDASHLTERIMAETGDWQAEVMKAGHHGSRNSTSPEWITEVRPETVVFSAGRGNRYGHPHPEVVELAQDRGAKTHVTAQDGTVTFVLRPDGFELAE